MFYLFDSQGNTATFCPDYDRLFDMFATAEKEVTETDADGGEVTKTVKCLPDGYSIKEYDGYTEPGMLYLDEDGNVKERVFEVDEAEEAARAKVAALSELDTQYAADKAELSSQYLDAAMSGDTDTMDAIKQELAALNEKYDADYAELNK
ncbi:hypothetical protein [uncultured Mitsuokella sp.]|uniref:hypothetical protein n=1 Tax=uncultured Mitsuokella sp. TaxID=453120 RepID=UPI002598F4EA|nr:hypothetical protein [uncultured Mitsuokella sp.]